MRLAPCFQRSPFIIIIIIGLTDGVLFGHASPLTPRESPYNVSVSAERSAPTVGFVADPNGRGTISLVLSCTLTLILCVWSALHLNLPKPGNSRQHDILLYLRWIITGVFGPELIVFTAWRQWCSAKILSSVIAESTKAPRRNEWTLTHSFFASSGGFAFDLEQDRLKEPSYLPDDCPKRLVLTARGVALLARCGFIPDVSEEEIWDKSKANNLAKCLVLIQAAWMFAQVVGRLAAALPVTLLEINTIAHVWVLLGPNEKRRC